MNFETMLPFARQVRWKRLVPVMLTVVVSSALAGAAAAQDDQNATVLDRLVIGGGDSPADKAADNKTLIPQNSDAALKSNVPLAKTPRSVSVITSREIEDRAVTDMIQAVRYSAGVTTGQFGFDPRFDEITIRGFASETSGDFRDGLRQPYMNYATYRTDVFGLERIEILKGPASVLYGASNPGGIVNRVSKFADGLDHGELDSEYGSFDRKQVALDYGAYSRENDAFSWRLVGVARNGDTDYGIADDRLLLQPSVRWSPDDSTSLTVYAIAQKDETDANPQTFMNNGRIIRYSDPEYDYQRVDQFQTGYKFEHEFDDGLKFSQHVRYDYLDLRARYLDLDSIDDATNVMHRYPVAITDHQNAVQADNRLEGKFDTGHVEHRLIGGLDYTWITSRSASVSAMPIRATIWTSIIRRPASAAPLRRSPAGPDSTRRNCRRHHQVGRPGPDWQPPLGNAAAHGLALGQLRGARRYRFLWPRRGSGGPLQFVFLHRSRQRGEK